MKWIRPAVLFLIGGLIYFIIEVIWRGHSDPSMFVAGGVCFVMLGRINEIYSWNMPLWLQMLIGMCLVTVMEFAAGMILNVWLGLHIWDYSLLPYQVMGQVSLYYSIAWFFLSLPAIVLDDFLRYWFFHEEWPHYRV